MDVFQKRAAGATAQDAATGPAPDRRGAVQRRVAGLAGYEAQSAALRPPRETQAIAAQGVAAGGGPLPHAAAVKASFGPAHAATIDSIRSHVGGPAAAAADTIGAAAYTTGSRIAFAREPDLGLAAHEAAHVVQQARGVHLSGGVGQTGDAYEQHADRVAAAVVRGESARALLPDGPQAGGAGGAGGAVQRAPARPTAKEAKNFCGADWIQCGRTAKTRPQRTVAVRPKDRTDAPRAQPGLSGGKAPVIVEIPQDFASSGPFVTIYLIDKEGKPIRGGTGLLYLNPNRKEEEVEVDRSAADAVGAGARAVVVDQEIDLTGETRLPKTPVPIKEVAKVVNRVHVRLDIGSAEGAWGVRKAKVTFGGTDGAESLEFTATALGSNDGKSYRDFEIDDPAAVQRIGNLHAAVAKGLAFGTLVGDADKAQDKAKDRSPARPRK